MITTEQLLAGMVIPIDKPRQWTSFQAVNKIKAVIRNRFGIKKFKIGHAGTLDPLATGLLLVCVGRATKDINRLQEGEKEYSGTIVFGATTPCHDLEQPIDRYYPYGHITLEALNQARQQFIGVIQQVPPIFSAVKIDGRRAYELARVDDPSALPKAKDVHIERFDFQAFRPGSPAGDTMPATPCQPSHLPETPRQPHRYNNPVEAIPAALPQADFYIRCGKGTYIRSLARDLGIALQSGAFLSALRRERIGEYSVDKAIPLEKVESFFDN